MKRFLRRITIFPLVLVISLMIFILDWLLEGDDPFSFTIEVLADIWGN
jgi:hypothetical protein